MSSGVEEDGDGTGCQTTNPGDADSPGTLPLNRRSCLKRASGAVMGFPLVSGSSDSGSSNERHGIQFEHVVDAVEDLGCDPNGTEPAQGRIRDGAADDTLIEFPAGTYRISDDLPIRERRNFGMYGDGDVTFEIPADTQIFAVTYEFMVDALFEGIDIDQTAVNAIGITRFDVSSGKIHVNDVRVDGPTEPMGNAARFRVLPYARAEDARVVVENFVAPDGGKPGTYRDGGGGVYVGGANKGTVVLRDCHFEGFPNNGAYVSRTPGTVQIEGGTYKNNEISQIRLSGSDSYAEDVTCLVDHDDWREDMLGDPSDARNTRMVWWEERDDPGGEIRDSQLVGRRWDGDPVCGAIVINGSNDAVSVSNTEIRCPDDMNCRDDSA